MKYIETSQKALKSSPRRSTRSDSNCSLGNRSSLYSPAGDRQAKPMDTEVLYSHDFLPEEFYNMLSLFQLTQTDIIPL